MDFNFTAEEVINEGRTTIEAVETIRDWMEECDYLPNIPDEMIVIFLLSCNNEISATKNTIKAYYLCKKNAPEIYDDRDVQENVSLQKSLKVINMASIPVRTKENNIVHIFRLVDFSVSKFDLIPLMKLSYMLLDVTQKNNPPDGLIVVMDMKGFGLMHITKLNMSVIKKYVQFLQEGFPIQMKKIHFINAVYFFDKLLNLFKMIMKSEILKMIIAHKPTNDMSDFFENCVPAECMPSDYGGKLETFAELHEKCIEQLIDRRGYFEAEERNRKNIEL